jgi:hypothetical protein
MTLNRIQLSVVTFGCAVGLAFAFLGAAYAVDAPPASVLPKGDRIAVAPAEETSVTIEEVNLDMGVSNLIRIEASEPAL